MTGPYGPQSIFHVPHSTAEPPGNVQLPPAPVTSPACLHGRGPWHSPLELVCDALGCCQPGATFYLAEASASSICHPWGSGWALIVCWSLCLGTSGAHRPSCLAVQPGSPAGTWSTSPSLQLRGEWAGLLPLSPARSAHRGALTPCVPSPSARWGNMLGVHHPWVMQACSSVGITCARVKLQLMAEPGAEGKVLVSVLDTGETRDLIQSFNQCSLQDKGPFLSAHSSSLDFIPAQPPVACSGQPEAGGVCGVEGGDFSFAMFNLPSRACWVCRTGQKD